MLARLAGIKTGIITKRISETVALRARDLKIDHVYQGIQDKASVFAQILEKDGITAAEAAFVGDDVIDLPAMRKCGLAIAVKNARPEVKAEAHWATSHAGGDGAARDAIEYILKAQGKWKRVVEEYIAEKLRRTVRIASQLAHSNAEQLRAHHPPVACLGRARVSNRWVLFSLLTLLFSGA